ncbi:MAG: histone deacetylase [Planctomycetes bacterium]|nr:histone deacetylase [Planctomycetota bacterium]
MRPAFVHSPAYDFRLPAELARVLANLHHFDGLRAQRAWALFEAGGAVPAEARLAPREVTRAELERVHTGAYLASLASPEVIAEVLEVPLAAQVPLDLLERAVLAPMRLATGGTVEAARHARERGLVVNLAGGYHHAKPWRGEGFCVYADLAIALEAVRAEQGLARALVIDLDAHQGNGVEAAYLHDERVAVFDVYNADIWPQDEQAKAGIRWDHPLRTGARGAEYLGVLEAHLGPALDEFAPELALYNAGTDVVAGDPLGLMELGEADVLARDVFVLESLARRGVPTVVTTSGGYTDASHRMVAAMLGAIRARWM